MMAEVLLQVSKRDVVGKQVKTLRRDGLLPAIVYGRGISSIPISINSREANKILSAITSSNLVVLDIDGDKHTTLVREKQRDPVTGEVLHMDFYEVSMTEKLRTNVGLEFQGESPAVKELMGVLVTVMESLEVECLPQDLPNQIVADLSTLEEIGDSLYVRDISLPPNVELISDIDGLVVVISPPAAEEIEEVEEVEITEEEPEVIERGKEEEVDESEEEQED
jgi:large subunit ribosomal protein L25